MWGCCIKKILDSHWNKLLCKFWITVLPFPARVESSTCTNCEKCNNGRSNSEISYTTDCLYSFWDRQKAEFFILWLCAFFHQPFCLSKEKFSQVNRAIIVTMRRFKIFIRINQDQIFEDDIDYKCYVKNSLRFFNNKIAWERSDKKFKEFCCIGLLKILII